MNLLILDTETTGLGAGTEVVELSMIDMTGQVVMDTLVKPSYTTSWDGAERIHGISPAHVADAPSIEDLMPELNKYLCQAEGLIIYNRQYDLGILREAYQKAGCLMPRVNTYCAMLTYGKAVKASKWQSLVKAAAHVGHVWTGEAHRALSDCYATLDVWNWSVAQLKGRID